MSTSDQKGSEVCKSPLIQIVKESRIPEETDPHGGIAHLIRCQNNTKEGLVSEVDFICYGDGSLQLAIYPLSGREKLFKTFLIEHGASPVDFEKCPLEIRATRPRFIHMAFERLLLCAKLEDEVLQFIKTKIGSIEVDLEEKKDFTKSVLLNSRGDWKTYSSGGSLNRFLQCVNRDLHQGLVSSVTFSGYKDGAVHLIIKLWRGKEAAFKKICVEHKLKDAIELDYDKYPELRLKTKDSIKKILDIFTETIIFEAHIQETLISALRKACTC